MFIDKYIIMLAVCQFIRHLIEACYGKPVRVEKVTPWSRGCHVVSAVIWVLASIHLWGQLP